MTDDANVKDEHQVDADPNAETGVADEIETRTPEYAPVTDTSEPNNDKSIARFLDVAVTISAELGRVTIPIGELMELNEGSVVELNRSVSSPIDLMAQGRRVATGEVVVVDDCFAVRIKSIESAENTQT
ncbi:MAG: flagellar motor switch protein FliN [Pirellulaceae bacterium]|nr:flagellar motor switch protein FliN [Pirellulaceae bacterium]